MKSAFPIFYDSRFANHNTGPMHPENAGRLTAIVKHLKQAQKEAQKAAREVAEISSEESDHWVQKIEWIQPSDRAVLDAVHKVHSSDYVAALKAFASRGGGHLDGDTLMSEQSYDVALLAVAAWLDGVDWVWQHQSSAFAMVRPPGHHAEADRAMGFCLLSNAAIAAHYAISHPDIQRVAILDWDVHHGNGTEALVASQPQIAYCSFHQQGAYPGTGPATETGQFQNVLNIPLSAGSQLSDYQTAWTQQAGPFLEAFDADILLVSAGYDANQADPLAGMCLHPEDYGWFTQECLALTPKVLFGLEGGYDYPTLSQSVAATIRTACL